MWITLILHSFQESLHTSASGKATRYSSTNSLDLSEPRRCFRDRLTTSSSACLLRSATVACDDYTELNCKKKTTRFCLSRKLSTKQKLKSSLSDISTISSTISSKNPSASSETSLPGYTLSISPVSSDSSQTSLSVSPDPQVTNRQSLTVPACRRSGRRRHHSSGHLRRKRSASFGHESAEFKGLSAMGHQQLEHRQEKSAAIMEPTTSADSKGKPANPPECCSPSPISGTSSPSGSGSL